MALVHNIAHKTIVSTTYLCGMSSNRNLQSHEPFPIRLPSPPRGRGIEGEGATLIPAWPTHLRDACHFRFPLLNLKSPISNLKFSSIRKPSFPLEKPGRAKDHSPPIYRWISIQITPSPVRTAELPHSSHLSHPFSSGLRLPNCRQTIRSAARWGRNLCRKIGNGVKP